jgi:hypothetical protein
MLVPSTFVCLCRVRQLGQKQVAKQMVGNVIDRSGMETTIADLGTQAAEAGLTSAQVWTFLISSVLL